MIPIDKQYHFLAGLCIYLVSMLFFSLWVAMVPVIIIGTAKEIYDYVSKKGNPEVNDFLFTIYGALPMFMLRFIIQELTK